MHSKIIKQFTNLEAAILHVSLDLFLKLVFTLLPRYNYESYYMVNNVPRIQPDFKIY